MNKNEQKTDVKENLSLEESIKWLEEITADEDFEDEDEIETEKK